MRVRGSEIKQRKLGRKKIASHQAALTVPHTAPAEVREGHAGSHPDIVYSDQLQTGPGTQRSPFLTSGTVFESILLPLSPPQHSGRLQHRSGWFVCVNGEKGEL